MSSDTTESIFSVDEFLTRLNVHLSKIPVRVCGEVVHAQEQGNAVYLTLRDPSAEAVLAVFMWRVDYRRSGVVARPGDVVIVEGVPNIYKPSGRFSLRAATLSYAGEGALKRSYDALYAKLAAEGLFDAKRKRPLPEFPRRIGLITSRQGAVIHDFLNNIGRFGFIVRFHDTRVEGAQAIDDLCRALARMRRERVDCVVLIRGGGSLESLQAFNSEAVVRAITALHVPVVCAIGHDADVPLAQLVADAAPSTPTAAAVLLSESWRAVPEALRSTEVRLRTELGALRTEILDTFLVVERSIQRVRAGIIQTHEVFANNEYLLRLHVRRVRASAETTLAVIAQQEKRIRTLLASHAERLAHYAALLKNHDPLRLLQLGYAVARTASGRLVRSTKDVHSGDVLTLTVRDGTIAARVH